LKKIFFNADDFGLSPGTNTAIIQGFKANVLDRASIMVTTNYSPQAVDFANKNPKYEYGLHFDLTYGSPLSNHYNWKDDKGFFSGGFFTMWKNTLTNNTEDAEEIVRAELIAQLSLLKKNGIKVTHINGHDHIHMIPLLNRVVRSVAKEYMIFDIRDINENILKTAKQIKLWSIANPRRIAKFSLFKILSFVNGHRSNNYFYSILFSCEITKDHILRLILEKYDYNEIEVMLHPGNPKLDKDANINNDRTLRFLLSNMRTEEYEAMFSNKEID